MVCLTTTCIYTSYILLEVMLVGTNSETPGGDPQGSVLGVCNGVSQVLLIKLFGEKR